MTILDPSLGDFLLWAQSKADTPMSKLAYELVESMAGEFVSESIIESQKQGLIGAVREVRMASANSEGFPPFAVIDGEGERDEFEESIARHPSGRARQERLRLVEDR